MNARRLMLNIAGPPRLSARPGQADTSLCGSVCCAFSLPQMGRLVGHVLVRCRPWLWHKNIQHTVRYTEMAPDRFRDFWRT
jgi:hypothetical protein